MKTENNRTYCIIGMDNVKGLEHDVNSIASAPATFLIGQRQVGLIGIFKCKLDPDRIKKVLNIGGDRSFFISEMNPATFSAHVDVPEVHDLFFGEFDKKQKNYTKMSTSILDFVMTGSTDMISQVDVIYNEEELSSLSDDQRSVLMDKLLTNVTKLTDNQKKALNFLASL